MSVIGTAVIGLIMLCAAIGAVASIRDPEHGLGKEFLEGLHSIGHIFVPVAGIMASIPFFHSLLTASSDQSCITWELIRPLPRHH